MKIQNKFSAPVLLMAFLTVTIPSWAMESANAQFVKKLTREEQEILDTTLFQAVLARNTEAACDALQAGAQVNAKNQHGETPLALAAEANDANLTYVLFDHNADVDACDRDGITPLMIATHYGNTAIEQVLLRKIEENEKVRVRKLLETKRLSEDEIGRQSGHVREVIANQKKIGKRTVLEVIDQSIKKGANINAPNLEGNTALIIAAAKGDTDIIRVLLDNKADVHAKNQGGEMPLLAACSHGHKDAIALLLERKADANVQSDNKNTSLIEAARKDLTSSVELLLDGKADVHAQGDGGDTALMEAAYYGHTDIAALLISRNACPDAKNVWENTPLMWAAHHGHTQTMQLLIDKKADVNATDSFQRAPLVWAAKEGRYHAAKLLLDNKAEVNPPVDWINNPLIEAAANGHSKIVKLLLDNGADSNVRGESNRYDSGDIESFVLSHAAVNGHREVAELLITKQADVCAVDGEGKTALNYAAAQGDNGVVLLLLDNLANANELIKQQQIKDALGDAIKNNQYKTAKTLVLAGADFRRTYRNGMTLWQLASQKMKWVLLAAEKERRIAEYTYVGQSAERAIHFLETRYPLMPPSAIATRGQQRTFSSRPLAMAMVRNTTVQSLLRSKNKSAQRAAVGVAAGIALVKTLDMATVDSV